MSKINGREPSAIMLMLSDAKVLLLLGQKVLMAGVCVVSKYIL